MNKEEATYLRREIISSCEGLNEHTVILMPINGDNVSSQECKIHIKPTVTEQNFQRIKNLVKKTNLSVIDEPDGNTTTIYGIVSSQE